jgi:hypothetical protein
MVVIPSILLVQKRADLVAETIVKIAVLVVVVVVSVARGVNHEILIPIAGPHVQIAQVVMMIVVAVIVVQGVKLVDMTGVVDVRVRRVVVNQVIIKH